jgi:phosphoserine / homoserine phosphotransferase
MNIVCLDLEGVLTPEIWINVSKKTGIEELKLTTRDISDYDVLMNKRIGILDEHDLALADIQEVIAGMDPLEGAGDFIEELRAETQVIILSDTFTQFAQPLMKKLGWPTLFCNELLVSADNRITGYKLRQKDGKKKAVIALRSIGYTITAAGDSYNDLTMLQEAEYGVLFRPPDSIVSEHPEFPVAQTHAELKAHIFRTLT